MQVDDKLISYLEDLSCLALSDDEKLIIKKDLPSVLACLGKIKEIDTTGVQECSHPLDNVNVFRADEAQSSLDRELALKNAAYGNDEFFSVPKTVD